jgi:hypothetical protein
LGTRGGEFKSPAASHLPASQRARAWEQKGGGSQALLEGPLLSCQPGRARPRAGQMSLVCWRQLPWKPEALRPGPVVPNRALAIAKDFSVPVALQVRPWGPGPFLGFQQSLTWPPSTSGGSRLGHRNPECVLSIKRQRSQ